MIDPQIQAELRARFNPDGSPLRNLQLRMLEMLKYIDKVCQENDIKYWLSSGTCLGAVRHGGFIPWDDDVDIEMMEDDYKKFLKVMGTEPRDGYILQTRSNEPTYIYSFAKIRDLNSQIKERGEFDCEFKFNGAFIDVFHLQPSNSEKIHKLCAQIYGRGIAYKRNPGFIRFLKCKIFRFITLISFPILKIFDSIGSKKQLRHSLGSYFFNVRYIEDVSDVIPVLFEDHRFYIPKNYDSYLTNIYGNYMVLPDLKKIHNHAIQIELN